MSVAFCVYATQFRFLIMVITFMLKYLHITLTQVEQAKVIIML